MNEKQAECQVKKKIVVLIRIKGVLTTLVWQNADAGLSLLSDLQTLRNASLTASCCWLCVWGTWSSSPGTQVWTPPPSHYSLSKPRPNLDPSECWLCSLFRCPWNELTNVLTLCSNVCSVTCLVFQELLNDLNECSNLIGQISDVCLSCVIPYKAAALTVTPAVI